MSATTGNARPTLASRIPRPSADTWETVWGVVYLVMGTNIMLAVSSLPLIVLLITTDPRASWPALALAAVAAFPGLGAAAAVFTGYTTERSTDVVRTFLRGWVRSARRLLVLGAVAVGVVVVVVMDIVWLTRDGGGALGAALVPLLTVLGLLAVSTTILAIVASVERPDARLRQVLTASLYLGVRRWYLTLASLAVLGLLAGLFTLHPAAAIGLAATPLLYVVWGNARYCLRPVLPVGSVYETGVRA